MAGYKETPRQKMIGMMYLVYTALLAMNVSKDILDAFDTVNTGVQTTNITLSNQISQKYAAFEEQYGLDQEKVGPYWEKAQALREEATDFINYVEALKWDFGFMSYDSAEFHCPNNDNPVMIGVGIETDFLDDAIFDTVSDISQIPDEDIEKYTLVVADKMREVMNSFQAPDSLLPNTAIIVGQGPIEQAPTNDTYDDYIMTVARSLVIGMIDERLHPNTAPNPGLQQQKDWNHSIMDDAQTHGHIGYITAADSEERALWLFFYDDQEECNSIINHISEDMIIK